MSKAQALQRAGRAGRTGPGKCYRLYKHAEYERFRDHQMPEIQRENLANMLLHLQAIGIPNIEQFQLIDRPPAEAIEDALRQLRWLEAIDHANELTSLGFQVQAPLEGPLLKVA